MAKYRDRLPQLSGGLFLTDGGIETTLIFHEGLELPDFAAFHLLKDKEGVESLRKYFRTYTALARDYEVGFILESPTWRASPDWGTKLGYSKDDMVNVNRKAIELLTDVRNEFENDKTKLVISGCVGPRGDGYNPRYKFQQSDGANLILSVVVQGFNSLFLGGSNVLPQLRN
jgi:S-methylmethionine-dependent homocysteine/selenocysteine methylase